MSTTSKIAIIGLGNIGKTLAQNFVKGNQPVIIASRKLEDAKALAKELGTLATATEISEAIKNADIIVLSVWFNTIQELFEQFSTDLQGKIIIDPSNPIAPDESGGFKIVKKPEPAVTQDISISDLTEEEKQLLASDSEWEEDNEGNFVAKKTTRKR